MYVPFHMLPDTSRLWVYQADSPITETKRHAITDVLMTFTESWEVHGKPMRGSFEILDDYFVIIAADEHINAASGCSIDDSVRVIRSLGEHLSIDFFNRNNVVFKNDQGIATVLPLAAVKNSLQEKALDGNSRTYNTLIQAKSELQDQWIVPLSKSWLKRFLPQERVSH